ncbi:MAG: hypothetical protein J6J24_01735 [Clostridia bacterium]|nr:hypothetical protein [Clostridia bacterium]
MTTKKTIIKIERKIERVGNKLCETKLKKKERKKDKIKTFADHFKLLFI